MVLVCASLCWVDVRRVYKLLTRQPLPSLSPPSQAFAASFGVAEVSRNASLHVLARPFAQPVGVPCSRRSVCKCGVGSSSTTCQTRRSSDASLLIGSQRSLSTMACAGARVRATRRRACAEQADWRRYSAHAQLPVHDADRSRAPNVPEALAVCLHGGHAVQVGVMSDDGPR